MLDQVTLACAPLARAHYQPADGVEPLITREDQELITSFPAPLVLLLHLVNELTKKIEHAVAFPGFLPQVTGGVALLRGRHRRVSGTAELPSIEGQEARLRPGETGRHIDEVGI